jgi:hypothetical protein
LLQGQCFVTAKNSRIIQPFILQDKDRNGTNPNPILSTAVRLFKAVAPAAPGDPEKALRDLVPGLRFLVVAQVEKPALAPLIEQKAFSKFARAFRQGSFRPFLGELAKGALLFR